MITALVFLFVARGAVSRATTWCGVWPQVYHMLCRAAPRLEFLSRGAALCRADLDRLSRAANGRFGMGKVSAKSPFSPQQISFAWTDSICHYIHKYTICQHQLIGGLAVSIREERSALGESDGASR